jgi:hypothetical protein
MSRSGYTEDMEDYWAHIRWRGAVESALRGKRGQAFLREILEALDALPEKKLVANSLVRNDGCACTLGAVALKRGMDTSEFRLPDDADEYEIEDAFRNAGYAFGIADAMAREIMWHNDDGSWNNETDEQRFVRMRRWVECQIIEWETP